MWTYAYTTRYVWDEINVAAQCGKQFGLPRIHPNGWKRYEAIRSVRVLNQDGKPMIPENWTLHTYDQQPGGWLGWYEDENGKLVGFQSATRHVLAWDTETDSGRWVD